MASRAELWVEKRNAATRLRELMEKASTENRAMTDEERGHYDAAADRIQAIERQMSDEDRHAALMKDLEGSVRTRDLGEGDDDGGEGVRSAAYAKAHSRYLRFGQRDLSAEERSLLRAGNPGGGLQNRALSALIGSAGGYFLPTTFQSKLTETQKWYGGALQAGAEEFSTDTAEEINWPTNDDTANIGSLLGQEATVPNGTDVTFGFKALGAYMATSGLIKVPIFLMSEATFDLEAFVIRRFASRLGRLRNKLYTIGTGSAQPLGMVTGAATTGTPTAANNAITWQEIVGLEHSVDPAYRQNGKYMWSDATLLLIRLLAETTTGRPLWEPSLKEGQPSMYNGRPYIINNDMPAPTTANKAILFGDFNSFYVIRNVGGQLVVRMEESFIQQLLHGFFAVERYDATVQDVAAVKALQMKLT